MISGYCKCDGAETGVQTDTCGNGLCSLTLVQGSCQCVDAAAVCVRGQRVLCGHGRDVVG